MKILYIDMPSGISGDMTLSAFLDAGVPEAVLRDGLARFGAEGFELIVEPGQKGGISGTHVIVKLDAETDEHTHADKEHTHDHVENTHDHGEHAHDHGEHAHDHGEHAHDHGEHTHEHGEHTHEHGEHTHDHGEHAHEHGEHTHDRGEHTHEHGEHTHDHGEHTHDHRKHDHGHEAHTHPHEVHSHGPHEHRNWRDIRAMIERSALREDEKRLAIRIFQRVAIAEGKVHGKPADEVGFHEVGAVDSIVDIVGAAICFCWLRPNRVVASAINTGSGFVRCQHGLLPVPAPATASILLEARAPIYAKGSPGERTTPTGAAIVAEFAQSYGLLPAMTVSAIGYGVGTKDFDSPNLLRMLVGEAADSEPTPSIAPPATTRDEIIVLEANLDDMTGEAAGYLMGKLLDAGARDVFYTSVQMKKNRPGMLLTVLTDDATLNALETVIFRESSTIGIRRTPASRSVMNRTAVTVEVAGQPVSIKVCEWNGIRKAAPEYEQVRDVAEKAGLPFRTVYRMAEAAYDVVSGASL